MEDAVSFLRRLKTLLRDDERKSVMVAELASYLALPSLREHPHLCAFDPVRSASHPCSLLSFARCLKAGGPYPMGKGRGNQGRTNRPLAVPTRLTATKRLVARALCHLAAFVRPSAPYLPLHSPFACRIGVGSWDGRARLALAAHLSRACLAHPVLGPLARPFHVAHGLPTPVVPLLVAERDREAGSKRSRQDMEPDEVCTMR